MRIPCSHVFQVAGTIGKFPVTVAWVARKHGSSLDVVCILGSFQDGAVASVEDWEGIAATAGESY